MKSLGKFLAVLVVGFAGGIVASLIVIHSSLGTSLTSSQTKTSQVNYQNTTATTEAVKVVQDAVVSVINYKTQSSDSSSFYAQIFGSQSSSDSQGELSVYSEGSGVIYKKEGNTAYLVTNTHVIEGAEKIEILLADGSKVVGELVGSDVYSDLAVIKMSAEKITTIAEFADSSKLNVGEIAIAIGSPLGSEYANSVTEGIVSSLSRTVTSANENGQTVSTNAIQTDAAINPGNSGGALINIQGQVIGINSSKIASSNTAYSGVAVEGMGFAIPSNDVVAIIKQLEESGQVTRPALGISMANLSEVSTDALSILNIPAEVTSGIVVADTYSGMPADGKLERYDVITKIDGKEVSLISDLQSILYTHKVGDSVDITFYRGQEEKTITIKLDKSSQDLTNS